MTCDVVTVDVQFFFFKVHLEEEICISSGTMHTDHLRCSRWCQVVVSLRQKQLKGKWLSIKLIRSLVMGWLMVCTANSPKWKLLMMFFFFEVL